MKATSIVLLVIKAALAATVLFISTTILFAQEKEKFEKADKMAHAAEKMANKGFCGGDSWSNGDKVSFRDLREMTIPASGSLSVDGGKNGGIKVKGSDRSDIQVRACVQAWGASEEAARALASSVRISTSGTIKGDAASDENWGVSYEVLVPRSMDLNLKAHNGGIAIASVEGRIEFETLNGGVHLMDVGGDVK